MEKKVTLRDVAAYVGVSMALVSYALNGKEKEGRVSADMVFKIRKAAEKLNYQPNIIARSLKIGQTKTIGLIVADISNPFFSNIARVIEDEAAKMGYVVIFGSSDESEWKQKGLIDVFINRQVDAFIIAPALNSESQIKMLQKKGIPVILIDRYFVNVPADSIQIDNHDASQTAVQHLINNGRRKIAMVAYNSTERMLPHMQDRKNGYQTALKKNGIKYKSEWLVHASYENLSEDVNHGLGYLLENRMVDAVMFATNSLAIAGLKKINELNLRIPNDLALVSFDESDVFDFFYSRITYVSQSVNSIGEEAVFLAMQKLKKPDSKSVIKIINAKLIIRESCGINMKTGKGTLLKIE